MAILVVSHWNRDRNTSAQPVDLMQSALFFGLLVICTATALHIALGGWIAAAYLPMWALSAVMIMIMYDVPNGILRPVISLVGFMYLADMSVEFRTVEAFPAFVSQPMYAVYHGLRAILPIEPVAGLPDSAYSFVMINNFFTPMGILLWVLLKLTQQRREWQAKSDQVLYNLMPVEIANKLRRGVPSAQLTQHHAGVTCFFSDVVGYTAMCDRLHDPAKVMEMLDDMYTAFDCIAQLTGAYKIETIGDAYFAVATLHDKSVSPEESCYRMAMFALAVREFMRGPFGQSHGIRVRCGLHTGDLVTGVLGDSRPRYVLVGDTVTTASRMETAAEPDTVNLSASAAEYLRAYFELGDRGAILVKDLGEMNMFELGDLKSEIATCPFKLPYNYIEISSLAAQTVGTRKVH